MDYKLKNGFVMKINSKGKTTDNTYLKIKASGYHGDADYDVNNETEIHFNKNKDEFKNLISFICYNSGYEFNDLKEECQKLFANEDDFQEMCDGFEGWKDFCTSYSEMHDQTIDLDVECHYVIEGEKYKFDDVELDIFKDEE